MNALGTCTLAIVMLSGFPTPELLPEDYRYGQSHDSTNYLNLNLVAAKLIQNCVVQKGEAGWQPTGRNHGIGIFVWSTDSQEDREIEDDGERFLHPSIRS